MHTQKIHRFGWLAALLIPVLILAFFTLAIREADDGRRESEKERLEEAFRRAAIDCYALEGAYPRDAEALIARRGLIWDREAFDVKYEYVGSNLMPDITVLVRGK